MKPLLEVAAAEYPDAPREELSRFIGILSATLDMKDERYERVVIIMILRAHYLNKPAALLAAEALYRVYESEVPHGSVH